MGGFCLLVELHREGSAPAACAAGLFQNEPIYQKPFFSEIKSAWTAARTFTSSLKKLKVKEVVHFYS